MTPLHMIELRPHMPSLLRFLKDQGLALREGDDDLGYGVHAWMRAAFGPLAPKPWRLFHGPGRPTRILGYAGVDAKALRGQADDFAPPSVLNVIPSADGIASKPMPTWQSGRRLSFELQTSPVGRQSRTGIEKDIFLLEADKHPDRSLQREEVYKDWALERLEEHNAAHVQHIHMTRFRLIRLLRRTTKTSQGRRHQHLVRPLVQLRGELIVQNPEAFTTLLAHGVGRHRAFGHGMLLVGPPP